jgi:periplasmic copper chaperone A
MTKPMDLFALAVAGALAPLAAAAHVTLEQPGATAGTTYKATFRVSHGCDGSPTRAITVRLPEGVQRAKPMPKPGWVVEVRPDAVTWAAANAAAMLPDAHYDEFVLRAQLPERTEALWFKVLQQCERGQNDWAEIPVEGTSTKGLKSPAALLQLAPAAASQHHH